MSLLPFRFRFVESLLVRQRRRRTSMHPGRNAFESEYIYSRSTASSSSTHSYILWWDVYYKIEQWAGPQPFTEFFEPRRTTFYTQRPPKVKAEAVPPRNLPTHAMQKLSILEPSVICFNNVNSTYRSVIDRPYRSIHWPLVEDKPLTPFSFSSFGPTG